MESYSQHLMRRFTKDRIIEIGRFMGIKIPTQYIKQDCARYLEDSVVALPQILINALSLPDFVKLKEIISNGHVISDLLNDDYFLLSGVGVVGVADLDGEGGEVSVGHYIKKQYKITVPTNLIEPIKAVIDDLINDPLVIQTDKLEKATIGIAVLYGILTDKIFVKIFNRLTNKSFTTLQLMSFVHSRRRLQMEIECHFFNNTFYLATMLLKSPKPLIDYVKSRKDLDYFEFDIDEVVKASYDLYAEQTPELDILRNEIIRRKINFADVLLFDVWNNTQNGDHLVDTINMFTEISTFDGINELNMFIRKVTDYTNSIHKWELKGHSSNSLFKGEQLKTPFPPAYPPYPHAYPPPFSKVIGRNDPCPCGSGKKYKQCCGNN